MNRLLSECITFIGAFVHKSFPQTSFSDFLTLELNMLSTLQFQSAHSAGSTHWSTAVCALQVLLVTFPHPSACLRSKVELWWVLQRVLLVCSQLLPVCAVQIHAKLSVSQTRSQWKRYGLCFWLFQPLMNTWKTKNHIHWRHQRAAVVFFSSWWHQVRLYRHLNIKFLYHCSLSRCFQVDDFTISILDKMKEIAQYPSAIRQMLWAVTHSLCCTYLCRNTEK